MMSQLAWEVEKKVECLPFPNKLKGREIWYFLELMFKPKVHYYNNIIITIPHISLHIILWSTVHLVASLLLHCHK